MTTFAWTCETLGALYVECYFYNDSIATNLTDIEKVQDLEWIGQRRAQRGR